MKSANAVKLEPEPTRELAIVRPESREIGRALSIEEISTRLRFIREVMAKEMKVDVDYGKIPGCGDKPTLKQPGAQKLLLTFQLREQVTKEVMREFPTLPVFGHREYEMTVTVFPAGGRPEDGWDGVGTCSTLEEKYRYRKAERKCPKCGHSAIIAENEKYLKPGQVAGWLCWAKKGGCGAKFPQKDPEIVGQDGGKTENQNPADCWNTARKIAFKRALVAAAINATNTSELWTQDLDDAAKDEPTTDTPDRPPTPPPLKPTKTTVPKVLAEAEYLTLTLKRVEEAGHLAILPEYLEQAGIILPNENLNDWPAKYVPHTKDEMGYLLTQLQGFANGDPAVKPFPAREAAPPTPVEPPKTALKASEAPKVSPPATEGPSAPNAPWRSFPVPFGKHSGAALATLDKGVLFGFWANFEVSPTFQGKDGKVITKTADKLAKDKQFRAMLDEAGKHYEFEDKNGSTDEDDIPDDDIRK
jgi:hypothetical protein